MSYIKCAVVALVLAGFASHATPVKAESNKCTFFTQADAERALHGPVVYLASKIDPTNCAWALTKDSGIGVTAARSTPPLYPPHDGTYGVSKVSHVTGVGQDAYTYYANAGSGGIWNADVLTAKGVTSVTLTEKAGNAATVLAIARSMMNR